VIGQPAEQVPHAMHTSIGLSMGLSGAFSFIFDGVLFVIVSIGDFALT
jgi:hypothetical protein